MPYLHEIPRRRTRARPRRGRRLRADRVRQVALRTLIATCKRRGEGLRDVGRPRGLSRRRRVADSPGDEARGQGEDRSDPASRREGTRSPRSGPTRKTAAPSWASAPASTVSTRPWAGCTRVNLAHLRGTPRDGKTSLVMNIAVNVALQGPRGLRLLGRDAERAACHARDLLGGAGQPEQGARERVHAWRLAEAHRSHAAHHGAGAPVTRRGLGRHDARDARPAPGAPANHGEGGHEARHRRRRLPAARPRRSKRRDPRSRRWPRSLAASRRFAKSSRCPSCRWRSSIAPSRRHRQAAEDERSARLRIHRGQDADVVVMLYARLLTTRARRSPGSPSSSSRSNATGRTGTFKVGFEASCTRSTTSPPTSTASERRRRPSHACLRESSGTRGDLTHGPFTITFPWSSSAPSSVRRSATNVRAAPSSCTPAGRRTPAGAGRTRYHAATP